jgi:hypothetical protein
MCTENHVGLHVKCLLLFVLTKIYKRHQEIVELHSIKFHDKFFIGT